MKKTNLRYLLASVFILAGIGGASAQPTIPASQRVPDAAVDTSQPGFKVRVHQIRTGRPGGNTIAAAEGQLRDAFIDANTGLPYENLANITGADADGFIVDADVINWSQDAPTGIGSFTANEEPIPGIPGTTASTDNIAAEMLTYLQLPAGMVHMGVNSDDGFEVRIGGGPTARDAFATRVGFFNAGRGTADSVFSFRIEEAGFYAARLIWFEGGGGANVEWFTFDANGQKILINNLSNANAIRAYRESTLVQPPFVTSVSPGIGAVEVNPRPTITVNIADWQTSVDPATVGLKLNGETVAATVTKNETTGVTTVTYQVTDLQPSSAVISAELTFSDNSTPPQAATRTWSFTTESYELLPTSGAVPASMVDLTKPGFTAHVHKAAQVGTTGLPNTTARAEDQLRGFLIDAATGFPYLNEAFPDDDGDFVWYIPGVINWSENAEATGTGNFAPNDPIPGIPVDTATDANNIAAEIVAFLELPAGVTRLGVNSDDGFRVTTGENVYDRYGPAELGVFEGGRGAANTDFTVDVTSAGLYPVRVVWYEGTGGANVEFYSMTDTGTRILVNDLSNAEAIKAYAEASAPFFTASIEQVSPAPDAQNAVLDSVVSAIIRDRDLALDSGSAVLKVDGVAVTADVQTVDGVTTVTSAAQDFDYGETHMAELSYTSGGQARSFSWSFTTLPGAVAFKRFNDPAIGANLNTLLTHPKFLENLPDSIELLPTFEADPPNDPSNYGGQLMGYFIPPTTGEYTFYIAADDFAQLWLSTDDNPANRQMIAREPTWNNFRDYTTLTRRNATAPENISPPIMLQGGQRYYIEGLYSEGGGGDHYSATIRGPAQSGGFDFSSTVIPGRIPIPAEFLRPFRGLVISDQPDSQTVDETRPVTFAVGVTALQGPLTFQWTRGGVAIEGATGASYTIDSVQVSDNGAVFAVSVTSPDGTFLSADATLTVVEDDAAPTLTGTGSFSNGTGGHNVFVCFDEPVDPATAEVTSRYTIAGATVTAAALLGDGTTVRLTVNNLPDPFTVQVTGVMDNAGNIINAGASVSSARGDMVESNIGTVGVDPLLAGSAEICDGRVTMTAGGSDIWNNADGGYFVYSPRTGDFDVRVRVERLDLSDHWAKAGIMARETIDAGSRQVIVCTTPQGPGGRDGYNAQERRVTSGVSSRWAGPPNEIFGINYPDAWVRMERVGDTFTAFWSTDGMSWEAYSQTTLDLPDEILLGLATTSHNNSASGLTTAIFSEFGDTPPPRVNVVSPGTGLAAGTPFTFAATALAEAGDSVASVEFFVNGQSIGTDTTAPFSIDYTPVAERIYLLSARMRTTGGAVMDSSTIQVEVGAVPEVFFVTESATGNASDQAFAARLRAKFGVRVTTFDDNNVLTQSPVTTPYALVAVSSTVGSGNVANYFNIDARPFINWEQALQDDMEMTLDSGADRGEVTAQTEIDIIAPAHAMAAGLSGTVKVTADPQTFTWGKPGAGAQVIATIAGDPDKAAIYVYEKGATSVQGFAMEDIRIHVFLQNDAFANLTCEGLNLIDAAVAYALGVPFEPEPCDAVEPPGELSIMATASGLQVSWTGGGSLQVADNVEGPWSNAANQNNPQTVQPTADRKFYRLAQ